MWSSLVPEILQANKAQGEDNINKTCSGTQFVQFEVMQKTLELDKNIQECSRKVTRI